MGNLHHETIEGANRCIPSYKHAIAAQTRLDPVSTRIEWYAVFQTDYLSQYRGRKTPVQFCNSGVKSGCGHEQSDFIADLDRKGVLRDGKVADRGLRSRRGLMFSDTDWVGLTKLRASVCRRARCVLPMRSGAATRPFGAPVRQSGTVAAFSRRGAVVPL